MSLAAPQTWTNNATLVVAGNVSNSGNLLTITGSGGTTISGIFGSGGGGLTMNGAGGLLTLSGTDTYRQRNAIRAGTLATGVNNALPSGTTVNFNGSTA